MMGLVDFWLDRIMRDASGGGLEREEGKGGLGEGVLMVWRYRCLDLIVGRVGWERDGRGSRFNVFILISSILSVRW